MSDPRTPMSAANGSAPSQWRSLEELEARVVEGDRDPFAEFIRREYPSQVHKLADPPERREFLKLMGASLALAGVGASCTRQPKETILPYAKSPESTIPGKPQYFATSMPWPSGSIGILVESHEGRPTKIEGNPDHPASLGATDAITQASILGLYDPDRSKTIQYRGQIRTWEDFLTALKEAMSAQTAKQGAGLRILTETVTSRTMWMQLREVLERYPEATWHQWDPVHEDHAHRMHVTGGTCRYDFERADVIVSLDADFLGNGPGSVLSSRQFAKRRRQSASGGTPCRLYAIETTPTLTGTLADHRLALKPSDLEGFAKALHLSLDTRGFVPSETKLSPECLKWLAMLRGELSEHKGRSIVIAGPALSPFAQFAAYRANQGLGNIGSTVQFTGPTEFERVDHVQSISKLTEDLRGGKVEILLILGGNPVYSAPADLDFAGALEAARTSPLRVHLALHEDETSDRCDWHIPQTHFLETWSDARSSEGTEGIVQPLIAPLYAGKSEHELLGAVIDRAGVTGHELVREQWKRQFGETEFESRWRRALHDGLVIGTSFEEYGNLAISYPNDGPPRGEGFELVFRPDPTIFDGRFANNGWLQELPKPITKLTWDNAAQVSPALAKELDVENEDVVELELDGRKVRAPIWIVPGQAEGTVVVHLGYGRTKCGRVGEGAGFNAYALRTTKAMWSASGLKVTKTGETRKLSTTQEHDRMEGRDPVRVVAAGHAADEHQHKEGGHGGREELPSLHTPHPKGDYSWGMVIDLASCTGCSACVAACNAENNVPIVGRDQVRRGREMHWIRVDRYFEGDDRAPAVHHQPIPCMHCENAPCETVCPVGATTHSDEGLNQMTYNRCVGTRYCLNNCPYKVRRFNFYLYQDFETEVTKLQRNPDVTVRSRGVMEKCSYCVQRIQEARIHAEKDGRKIRDGEVRTACQQVCPAEAIVFGNIDDPTSAVAKRKASPREYGLLEELNTRPRTTYLAKVVNPNPALAPDGERRAEGEER